MEHWTGSRRSWRASLVRALHKEGIACKQLRMLGYSRFVGAVQEDEGGALAGFEHLMCRDAAVGYESNRTAKTGSASHAGPRYPSQLSPPTRFPKNSCLIIFQQLWAFWPEWKLWRRCLCSVTLATVLARAPGPHGSPWKLGPSPSGKLHRIGWINPVYWGDAFARIGFVPSRISCTPASPNFLDGLRH